MDQQTRHVPVRFLMDSDALRAWLQGAAAEHNSEPQGPRLLPPANRWQEAGATAGEVRPALWAAPSATGCGPTARPATRSMSRPAFPL